MRKTWRSFELLLLALVLLSSCVTNRANVQCSKTAYNNDLKQSLKWYRNSVEQKALYRQIYQIGTRYVEKWVKEHRLAKPWGVILDIDETVLDNSWYYQQCFDVTDNEADYSRYISLAEKSSALPGAVAFTHRVHKLGGMVTLISNRDGSYHENEKNVLESTIKNLKEQGIYFDQVILANHTKSKYPKNKNPRFNAVKTGDYESDNMVWSNTVKPFDVIAYFGDNIQDFPDLFQKNMRELKNTDDVFNKFSQGYFLFPNPMYGSWEPYY